MTTRLLIAESHAGFRHDLGHFVSLLDGDYALVAAVDTAEGALDAAARLHPDVALVALDLRDRRGLAVTRALRAAAPDMAVIVLGGLFDADYRAAAHAAGAAAYIDKLGLVEELPTALRAVARAADAPTPAASVAHAAPAPVSPAPVRRAAGLAPWQWLHLLIAATCLLTTSALQQLRQAGEGEQTPTVAFILAALLGILLLEARQILRARPATWFVG